MSTNNTPIRPLENFSPSIGVSLNSQPAPSKVDSSSSAEDLKVLRPQKPRLNTNVTHNIKTSTSALVQATHPMYALSHANNSTSSLQSSNFTRTKTPNHSNRTDSSSRVMNQTPAQKPGNTDNQLTRKKSATQANIEQHTSSGFRIGKLVNNSSDLNISHVVAQAATVHQTHMRRRSQTVPSRGMEIFDFPPQTKGSPNTPILSLTEASWSRKSIANSQAHQNIIPSSVHGNVAQITSIPIISRSPAPSPNITSLEQTAEKERPLKIEKSKVKFFSRPSKVVTSKDKDIKIGLLPSPNMINFTSLQRANNNNINLSNFESQYTVSSVYSNANPSSSTIRPPEAEEKKSEKEKSKHHFLSRQKHKLTSKEDYNLPLSSSASNSKPVDPNAPSSLYNFNMPLNSTTSTASFSRGMSGLDLRHGGRALREKKNDKDERPENGLREVEISFQNSNVDKNESSNTGPGGATSYFAESSINLVPSMSVYDASSDIAGCGMEKLGPEDVWPFLRSKLLAMFEGEDLKLPVEDLNRIVLLHLQDTNRRRVKINMIDELKDLLRSGFTLMDQTLRSTPDQQFIPQLVEMWIYTFTAILPLMQAVFLPFDLELINSSSLKEEGKTNKDEFCIRSIVLRSFRDSIILSRFENLKNLFHNLHSEIISCIPDQTMLTPVPESSPVRPGTAMSLDPSVASYGSQNTMVANSGLQFSRNCKNNTFSGWSGFHYRDRDLPGEGGVQLATIIIGRLLQCIGVLNSVHSSTDDTNDGENIKEKMGELAKDLKVDLLEKKRMGCSRRALIGAKVRVSVRSFGAAIEV